ncbi:phosphatase PAP2 family protein [Halobacterium sp. R2-5]|uniref:phosphatase PAP2 family protein n=1 Tax=Halobacterium sp. R2-5 TaxID=2715751 RepID=UPI0014247E1F|nr:phosphatase PAP2 family protein [Halobacterium sp. R2-5]NIC00962.1 phosphatase PAP2 family protein [Halobacterium sp. R2-5]
MGLVSQTMEYYPYVVHPITVLGVGIVLLVHHEWARQGLERSMLWRRIGAFLGVGVLSLVPTVAYFLVVGSGVVAATQGKSAVMDGLVASGLLIAAALTWAVWRHFDWGPLVPGAMQALAVVTVPYALVSPFWDISGHVIISLMPALYLTLVNRRFWPLLVFPIIMVPNRIYLDAHTWEQSIAGFLVAALVVGGVYWVQASGSLQPELGTTTT